MVKGSYEITWLSFSFTIGCYYMIYIYIYTNLSNLELSNFSRQIMNFSRSQCSEPEVVQSEATDSTNKNGPQEVG